MPKRMIPPLDRQLRQIMDKVVTNGSLLDSDIAAIIDLLTKGANINHSNQEDYSLLDLALIYNKPEFAKILLTRGFDVNQVSKDGISYLHTAADYIDDYDCIKKIIAAIKPSAKLSIDILNCVDTTGRTALHVAVSEQKPNVVKALLEAGIAVDIRDINFSTALHLAVQIGHPVIIEMLLKFNASTKLCADIYGKNPLDYFTNEEIIFLFAKFQPTEEQIELKQKQLIKEMNSFIKSCEDIDKPSIVSRAHLQMSDLHLLAAFNKPQYMRLLLEQIVKQKENFRTLDLMHRTPLHLAATNNHLGAAIELLYLGGKCTTEIPDQNNKTPTQLAEFRGFKHLAKTINDISKKQKLNYSLFLIELVKLIREGKGLDLPYQQRLLYFNNGFPLKADLKVRFKNQPFTANDDEYEDLIKLIGELSLYSKKERYHRHQDVAMHVATAQGDIEVMELFIKENPDVINAIDEEGRTPLTMALDNQCEPAIRFLLQAPNIISNNILFYIAERNLIKAAAVVYDELSIEVWDYLLNIKDSEGMNPLNVALSKCHWQLADYFLEKCAHCNENTIAVLEKVKSQLKHPDDLHEAQCMTNAIAFYKSKNELIDYYIAQYGPFALHKVAENSDHFWIYRSLSLAMEIKKISIEEKDENGRGDFLHMVAKGTYSHIANFIQIYKSINYSIAALKDKDRNNALHIACLMDSEANDAYYSIAQYLLQEVPKIAKVRNNDGLLPIQVAKTYRMAHLLFNKKIFHRPKKLFDLLKWAKRNSPLILQVHAFFAEQKKAKDVIVRVKFTEKGTGYKMRSTIDNKVISSIDVTKLLQTSRAIAHAMGNYRILGKTVEPSASAPSHRIV